MFNFFRRNKKIEEISNDKKTDPYRRWNPDNKIEKDVEIYTPAMAKDIFPNTYAYKLYNKSNKDLSKTRDFLIAKNIDLYFTMYYDLALDFSNNKHSDLSLEEYLEEYSRRKNEDVGANNEVVYKTQLVSYSQYTGDFYYNLLDARLVNDLMGNDNEQFKKYIVDYIEKNGNKLFLNKSTNIYGDTIKYDKDIENKIIDLFMDIFEYSKKDVPFQNGDKEFIKKKNIIKKCMENMDVSEYYDDLEYALYEAEKEYFD